MPPSFFSSLTLTTRSRTPADRACVLSFQFCIVPAMLIKKPPMRPADFGCGGVINIGNTAPPYANYASSANNFVGGYGERRKRFFNGPPLD
jgi:hypothetical protein